jgi:UDP-4-amino-4,6-dideoxy-N-acetyl-beta-L-altrosamine transaminase
MHRDRRQALLPYGRQWIDEEDVAAVIEILRSDWITQGPIIERFEEALARAVGARFAVAFSSGTAALHGASFAAGIEPGDEVVTSPLAFAASANTVLYQGGRPVFADVSPDTGNLDPALAARALTPRTKAFLPVDYAGHPADLDAFQAMARERGLLVIEDGAHALGAKLLDRAVGSLADLTAFSFHPVKTITTGEGGAVTTDDETLARRLRRFRTHGITRETEELAQSDLERGPWYYEMQELGFNYRITDLQCALGLTQLKRLDAFVQRRQAIVDRYLDAFGQDPALLVPAVRRGVEPAWHLFPLRLRLGRLRAGRREVFEALRARGLGVQVHYIPIPLHPYYRKRFGYAPGDFPEAEAYYAAEISLPLFPRMTDGDVGDVIAIVRSVIDEVRT